MRWLVALIVVCVSCAEDRSQKERPSKALRRTAVAKRVGVNVNALRLEDDLEAQLITAMESTSTTKISCGSK